MRKLLLLLSVLLTGVSGAWAALSSSTIAKSGNVTDTWNITSALPTDNWTAMGDATPAGVTALGSYTAYSRTQDITLSADGALFITFEYSSGTHQLEILGVELLNGTNEVVRSHYHYGKTGTYRSNNNYFLDHITSGNYKIRFIINSGVSSSAGNITIKHLNIKTASSYADISHWYFVRMNTNATHYMYYNSGATTNVAFSDSKANDDKYLWGFVKDTEGVKIYNQAAGSSVAIDNANPCTLSASGQTFTIATGTDGSNGAAAEAYFALYKNIYQKNDAKSYLNYNSAGIKRHTEADAGSTFMIDEAPISRGKIYKIQAYFTSDSYNNLYFTNNNGTLAFNTSATNGVKDYWILRSSGNADYPWKFESGRGDGKYLSPQTGGVTVDGGWMQINNCTDITSSTYYHLRGSYTDKDVSNIRNLGTWSPDGNNHYSGFANSGPNTGCYGSGHVNDGYQWTTDYIIEEVTDADIYTVVCNIPSGGVTYTPTPAYTGIAAQGNGGFYILTSAPSSGDFTKKTVENYTAGDIVVDTSAKTITLNYTANITYTLTDMNGKTYEWSASGTFGTAPTLTGCDGYTLSNEVWNEEARTYTANIAFPFDVSSNSKTNWIYIRQFATSYVNSKFYWYSKGGKVYVEKEVYPTNGNNTSYEWAIIPSCSNGAFTFTIKNNAANASLTYTSGKTNTHTDAITLTSSGTSLEYVYESNYYRWAIPNLAQRLSINSSADGKGEQELGTYTNHPGTAVEFEEAPDFVNLLANLKTARNRFIAYLPYFINGRYTETVEETMMITNNQQATDRNVVKDPPTEYFTAAQFNTYTENYNNAVAGLRYVMPTFFRVKNVDGSKYVKASTINYSTEVQLSFTDGGTDAASIFYLNASNNIIAYNSGAYLIGVNHTSRVSNFTWRGQFSFLAGSIPERVLVYSSSEPTGWAGENKYWQSNGDKIERVTSTDASDFLIEEVTALPVTITAAKYATLCAPVALEIPEGIKAYYISNVTKTEATLTKLTGTIPADVPVILYADGLSETTTFDFPITTADAFDGTNKLSGQAAAQNVAADVAYTLQTASNVDLTVGFYPKAAGTIAGFRAYLLASELPADVKELKFRFDDADGILSIDKGLLTKDNDKVIYNLAGQRINKLQRGVNIVNGKKVIIK